MDLSLLGRFRAPASTVPAAGDGLTESESATLFADAARVAACPDCDSDGLRGDHVAAAVVMSDGWYHQLHV